MVGQSFPRKKGTPRPDYATHRGTPTTALGDQLSNDARMNLAARNIDVEFLDSLTPDVIHVKMTLPDTPVPETKVTTYNPDKPFDPKRIAPRPTSGFEHKKLKS